ncbi:hypothetical protein HRI_000132500 [Hibiscus trionum]|uniref:Uncharacterized protein n=1 Tax=Hibiscus trionum TaxID=183268 RepID=A0A9W7GT75_HIBTR|nr:hypothetical protein HRI_000132500 [Hibiscus trionum]
MRLFIKSNDYVLWDVVEDGPTIPMKRDKKGRLVPKTRAEMIDEDRRRLQVNDKALHIIFCALGPDMYVKMAYCTSEKEV